MKSRIVTGDRPTGRLHLGHLVGTLQNRVKLQESYECFFILADLQVLTDHLDQHSGIEANVFELMCDYLSIGLKPENCFFVQSQVPELTELTAYLSFMVTLARVQRNPTVKSEADMYGVGSISLGFASYPVSQAADILAFKADLIPVGQDQLPHIEQARELARTFNRTFGTDVFVEPKALVGTVPILTGTDGQRKMSKSLDNQVDLAHSPEETIARIGKMLTDKTRLYRTDPGHPDDCSAFRYWSIFGVNETETVRSECESATRGCRECKFALGQILNEQLEEVRDRRAEVAASPDFIWDVLSDGNRRARAHARSTLEEVREAMKISYPSLIERTG